jgi:hypothetical protein
MCVPADRQILFNNKRWEAGGGEAFTQEKNKTTQNPLSDFLSSNIPNPARGEQNRLSNWVATEIWFVADPAGGKKKVLKMMKERKKTTTSTTTITTSSSLKTTSTPTRGRKRVDGKLAKLGELQWNSTLTYNKRSRGKKNKKLGRSNYEQVPIQLQQQQ